MKSGVENIERGAKEHQGKVRDKIVGLKSNVGDIQESVEEHGANVISAIDLEARGIFGAIWIMRLLLHKRKKSGGLLGRWRA